MQDTGNYKCPTSNCQWKNGVPQEWTQRKWIGEIPGRCIKTVLIPAESRAEAERKLRECSDDIEGIDVSYQMTGYGRVIREDRAR